jgi:hypothetical protein
MVLHEVHLDQAIRDHCQVLIEMMDKIYAKAYKTIYRGHQKKLVHYCERLNGLRLTRDGILQIPFSNGSTLQICTFMRTGEGKNVEEGPGKSCR